VSSDQSSNSYQRLQPLERRWRAGVSLLTPAAIALAPKVAALGVPLCAFRHLTGVPCPLCGGTRICAALAHGDVSVALQLNPGLLPVLGLAALHSLLLLADCAPGNSPVAFCSAPGFYAFLASGPCPDCARDYFFNSVSAAASGCVKCCRQGEQSEAVHDFWVPGSPRPSATRTCTQLG